jgi:iron(III) transport system substrate-binding protein
MYLNRRRFGLLGAASLGATSLRGLAADAPASMAAIYEAAKKEGELTWYVVPYPSELAEAMGRAFTGRYPGIKVNVVRTTAQVAFQRLNQDLKAGTPACDVFTSTDLAHYLDLKSRKLLLKYTPPSTQLIDRHLRTMDSDGYYHATSAFMMGLVYNTQKVPTGQPPSSWNDLLDPKWQGLASVAHPGFSGAAGAWAIEMRKLYGKDWFKKLAANKPQVGRSTIDTVTTVTSGERSISAGPITLAARVASKGNPVGWVVPKEGPVLVASPSGIMADSRRPNASKLFMEWLIGSDEVVELGRAEFGIPLRAGLKPPGGLPALGELKNQLAPTPLQMRDELADVVDLWKDAFGV